MMRKTQVIGLVVASLVSAASFAQAQTATQNDRPGRRAEARGIDGRGGRGLFRGITLSDAEKARIKQVHEKYSAEAKPLRESLRPAMQDARAARQKGDTAAARAALSRTSGDREKLRALMDRQKAEIRSALTPENQRVFDANAKQLEQRRAEGRKNGKGDRGGRRAFRGGRGARAI
jgi:Spy/CpxP family protein refolding chaperone